MGAGVESIRVALAIVDSVDEAEETLLLKLPVELFQKLRWAVEMWTCPSLPPGHYSDIDGCKKAQNAKEQCIDLAVLSKPSVVCVSCYIVCVVIVYQG